MPMRQARTSELDLADVSLAYEQTGEGPDVVWLAAGDQPGSVWRRFQIPGFEPGFRNTTYDARGVGSTRSTSSPPWPIPTHAEDCIALIERVCSPPVFLVGLSMGSLIAQEICLTRPDLVRAAVVMGTTARKTGFLKAWEEAEIAFRRDGGTLTREFAIAHYAILMYPADALADDELWKTIEPMLDADFGERDGRMLAAQWQACLEYESLERLPACAVPLHVVTGSEDVQTPPRRGREVADAAPLGRFHLLDGLGHGSAFGHRPQVVNDCIRGILDEYAGKGLDVR
jgi:pimeloyl-ACP methyl ester carboxylesterase